MEMHCQGAGVPIWGVNSFLCVHIMSLVHTTHICRCWKLNYLQLGPSTHWGENKYNSAS